MCKTGKKTFEDFYKSLDEKKKTEIRDRFLEMTGLAYPSWYGKIRNMNFSKLETRALSDICGVEFN